ncbi:hypothetical protein QTP88_015760 [Uroleucon formosanum]
MSFHSYQQYDKRSLRVVIRNLHPSTSTEDIITSLSELGHQVTHVHNIKRSSDKSPLPLFFVDLKKATNNMDLYKIEYLLHTKIVVEKPHPRKGPPQCHRCMSYGHTQSYCNHSPRCIRCGEEHRSEVCTMSPESPARCALCQELIAKFDPLMSKYLDEYGNKGRRNVSYLSHTICDELITLINKSVLCNIVNEVTAAKYFSLIVDSTLNITKLDQLTITIRYVNLDETAVERFLFFIPSVGHKSKEMEVAILTKLTELNININYCRGKSYNNARNMSGMYNGLQARIKEKSKNAIFSPSSAYSLNLVGCHAADVTKEGYNFFSLAQNIYVFFSASTWRWEQLLISLKNIPNSMFVKNLCPTRWSSRFSVCKSLKIGFKGVLNSLKSIALNLDQKAAIRHKAESHV